LLGEGLELVVWGLKFAFQEVDGKARVVANLCGLPKAFVGVALEAELV
jgi:hypothetical protein